MRAENPPTCHACRSNDTRLKALLRSEIDGQTYRAIRCHSCGLVFCHPIPNLTLEALQEVYDAEYTAGLREIGQNALALHEATRRQMEIVEQYVPHIGRALNVGAMGDASQVLTERGWQLHIIDASRYAAETAGWCADVEVTISRLEDYDCPAETFDFVKLGHVIEHLADPRLALQRVACILKTGGVLLIDTDNAGGLRTRVELLARQLLGERLAGRLAKRLTGKNLHKRYGRLTPPEHLYTFSEQSLVKLLQETNFEVCQIVKPAWGDRTWFPLSDRHGFSPAEQLFIKLDQFGARFGMGEVIAVLARKR